MKKIINLLPKDRQQELYYDEIFQAIMVVIWLSLASFALVFLSQAGTKLYLENQAKAARDRIEYLKSQVSREENAKIKQDIKTVNNIISDYNSLVAASPKWSQAVKAFAALPPEGVKITSFVADTGKKTVTINGYSPTRELVLELYEKLLRDDKNFHSVNYPLENVAKPRDVIFHFTFSVKDEVLK